MSIWNPDLTTRMGAESAADMGGLGCFVYAGLCVLSMVISGGVVGYTSPDGILLLSVIGAQAVLSVMTGFRMRAGKGAFWGAATFTVMVLELIGKLISMAIGAGMIISVILLIVVFQGVRGAFALRRGDRFEDEEAEAFE
jgi:hypothetical protein